MELYMCSFHDALKIINTDFGLGLGTKYPNTTRIKKLKKKHIPIDPSLSKQNPVNFTCTISEFSEESLEYWKSFYIEKETLELFNVYEVSEIRKEGKFYKRASLSNPIYAYFFEDSNRVKFYRPLASKDQK